MHLSQNFGILSHIQAAGLLLPFTWRTNLQYSISETGCGSHGLSSGSGLDKMFNNPEQIFRLLDWHLQQRPLMEAQDVYKLIYQGCLGPEHLITSADAFAERLHQELEHLADLENSPPELLWEPVRPDQSLGRLNLRPYMASRGDLRCLVSACIETGKQSWGTKAEIQAAWEVFIGLCREDRWTAFACRDISSFSHRLKLEDYPAVHHSPTYRETYCPAYRLIAQEFLLR